MILLMDSWTRQSALLKDSLEKAGFQFNSICVLYDGNLPDDVDSPYRHYIEQYRDKNVPESGRGQGKPLFFNELKVPDKWEIQGTNTSGKVLDYDVERGRIFYTDPKSRREVKIVDWLDRNGEVRFSDHYDRFGFRMAQTVVREHKVILKSWFNRKGQEVITENFITGAVLLRDEVGEHSFVSRTDFVRYYLEQSGQNMDRVFYNSLSTPYLVVSGFPQDDHAQEDVLFWQEPIRDTIPGNMVSLFNGGRRTRIAVQMEEAFGKLRVKVKDRERFGKEIRDPERAEAMLKPVGFVYPYCAGYRDAADSHTDTRQNNSNSSGNNIINNTGNSNIRDNNDRKHFIALVVTNSDQVESLEQLVSGLPDVEFHVAALTEMSTKLTVLEKYANIRLHPACSEEMIARLLSEADLYLDINHGDEVLDCVYRAFLHEIPILAFDTTAHNRFYTGEGVVFPMGTDGTTQMIQAVCDVVQNPEQREQMIREQKLEAMDETPESFRKAVE